MRLKLTDPEPWQEATMFVAIALLLVSLLWF